MTEVQLLTKNRNLYPQVQLYLDEYHTSQMLEGLRRVIPIRLLKDEPFVFFPRSAGSFAWENTMRLCEQQGFHPNIVQGAPQWLTVVRLVGAGLGVTIFPASVQQILSPDVVCRRLSPSGGETSIDLVYRLDQSSPLVAAFSDVARTNFKSSRSSRRAPGSSAATGTAGRWSAPAPTSGSRERR